MDEEQQTFQIVPREVEAAINRVIEAEAQIVESAAEQIETDEIDHVTALLAKRKAYYLHRIGVIEEFLGFAQSEADLSVRMARIEKFVGIGG